MEVNGQFQAPTILPPGKELPVPSGQKAGWAPVIITDRPTNQPTNQPINSMGQSPTWEVNSHSASQEIPRLLWNQKVNYRIYKNPPVVPTWARCIQSTPYKHIFLRSILISSHVLLDLSGVPLGFPTKLF